MVLRSRASRAQGAALKKKFTVLSVLVKMWKIGRRRKYTHRKYENSQPTADQQTSSSPVLRSCQQPTEYQFPLRHLPSGILHQPSLYNFIQQQQKALTSDGVFNFIDHLQKLTSSLRTLEYYF